MEIKNPAGTRTHLASADLLAPLIEANHSGASLLVAVSLLSRTEGAVRKAVAMRTSWALAVTAIVWLGAAATASAAAVPTIENESVSHLTATEATLEAAINLHEAPADAYYQFQLATDPSEYASEILCPPTLQPGTDGCIGPQGIALPIGFIPGNTMEPSSSARASAGVTLKPGTTYHYRVLVARRVQTEDTIEWEPPTVFGADQTFMTSSNLPPSIEGESVSNVTPADATLEAKINTEGLETTYEFHLLERWRCEELHPACYPPIRFLALPSGKLLGSFVGQSVSLDLGSAGVSLSPAHNFYEYWVTATNAAGTTEGLHQTFTEPSEPPPSNAQTSGAIVQSSPAILSPAPASSLHHRKHHRPRHRRGIHRSSL